MDKESLVYVDLDGEPHFVGRLWSHLLGRCCRADHDKQNSFPQAVHWNSVQSLCRSLNR